MPFITPENRRKTDAIGPVEMGDRCFLAYRDMVRRWKKSRRWTTVHEIYRDVAVSRDLTAHRLHAEWELPAGMYDNQVAMELAWQIFFQKYVMVYENEKAAINGEVD